MIATESRQVIPGDPITANGLVILLDQPRQAVQRALAGVECIPGTKYYPIGPAIRAVLAARGGALDAQQERARKDKELADKYELENAQTRGELVSPAELDESLANFIATLKGSLRRNRKLKKPTKDHIMGIVRECLEKEAGE